jgi:hypothetical protein
MLIKIYKVWVRQMSPLQEIEPVIFIGPLVRLAKLSDLPKLQRLDHWSKEYIWPHNVVDGEVIVLQRSQKLDKHEGCTYYFERYEANFFRKQMITFLGQALRLADI